jgi:hypothetical protein
MALQWCSRRIHHSSKLDKNWPVLTPVQDHLIAALGSSLRHDYWEGSGAFNASVWGGLRGLPLFLFLPVR